MWTEIIKELTPEIMDKAVINLREAISSGKIDHEKLQEQLMVSYGMFINVNEAASFLSRCEKDGEEVGIEGYAHVVAKCTVLGLLIGTLIAKYPDIVEGTEIPDDTKDIVEEHKNRVTELLMGETTGAVN